jgi:hypothetical protein
MLKRTIAISLLLLLSVGILLPFADSTAHGVRQSYQIGARKHSRYRSRAWWRRYRARLRKKRAAALELAHRNALMSVPANLNLGNFVAVTPLTPQVATNATPASAPTVTLPKASARMASLPTATAPTVTVPTPMMPTISVETPSATKTNSTRSHAASPTSTVVTSMSSTPILMNTPVVVNAPTAAAPKAAEARPANETRLLPKNRITPLPGELSISVVALSRPNPAFLTAREEAKLLAGVNVGDLRRIVIDRMVTAGGWVTNDYVREINGGRVFVVTARTPRNGQTPEKAWTFYFTESGGRIYSLTTDSPLEHTDRMGKEAERFIGTLRAAPSQEEK